MKIKILLVDKYDAMRKKIETFINSQPNMEVIGEAKDGKTAIKLVKELVPDIVLLDMSLPKMNGIEVACTILSEDTTVKIILLSIYPNKGFVEQSFNVGVSGYIIRTSIFDDLIPAIKAVKANRIFLSPEIESVTKKRFTKKPPKRDGPNVNE